MKRLELTTFGGVKFSIDGQPIQSLAARKTEALLIYLALTGQKHSREKLAGLFWGDMPEEKARRNLRVALNKIRSQLEDYLIITRRSLAINPDNVWIDARTFESLLAYKPTIDQIERAVELYKGPFLADFFLRNAPLFDEWMQPLPERYRQLAMEALYRLSKNHTEEQSYDAAISYTQHLLELEPWMEAAHRQLMYLYALDGKRTLALNQYEICLNILWDELGVEPSAETRALNEQIRNGVVLPKPQPSVPPAKPAQNVKPIQIPASTEHFVGRSEIINSIIKDLRDENGAAIQALTGMGGIGKSTLATKVAASPVVQEEFTDGILWANAATSEPMSVLESWAAVYGYDFTRIADLESMAAAFRGVLSEKRVLIALDNVDSQARIRPLLPGNNHCRVLMTTRDQELALALNAKIWRVRELSPDNSRLLLSSILGNERVAAEPLAADQICSLLQNLPLAVEITAQRLKSHPYRKLKTMADRLQDETQRLSLLKISDREVRASFAISWEALDAERRRVFALIGLFKGRHFTADAMSHIAEMGQFTIEDRLFDLINLSLLRAEGPQYYYQHPLLADFAKEKLGQAPEPYIAFAQYYTLFANENSQDYAVLSPEWNNLTTAIELADKYEQWPFVFEFAKALETAWFARGRYAEASRGFQLAYKAAEKANDQNLMAECLYKFARALIEQSLYDEAHPLLLRSLDLFNSLNNESGIANTKFELARIALEKANYDEAQQYLIESRQIREIIEDNIGVAETIARQARIFFNQGKYQKAYELSKEAVDLSEAADYKPGLIKSLRTLVGSILELHKHGLGQPDRLASAKDYCERALELAEELQDRGEQAVTLYVLSRVYLFQNDFEEAEKAGRQSLKLLERIGDQRSQGVVLSQLGDLYYAQGKFENALEVAYLSLNLFQKLGNLTNIAVVKSNLGLFHKYLNHPQHAKKYWEEALEMAEEVGHSPLVNRILKRLEEEE